MIKRTYFRILVNQKATPQTEMKYFLKWRAGGSVRISFYLMLLSFEMQPCSGRCVWDLFFFYLTNGFNIPGQDGL